MTPIPMSIVSTLNLNCFSKFGDENWVAYKDALYSFKALIAGFVPCIFFILLGQICKKTHNFREVSSEFSVKSDHAQESHKLFAVCRGQDNL